MSIDRRTFLKGAGVGAGAGIIATVGVGAAVNAANAAPEASDSANLPAVPLYGRHQPGVLEAPQASGVFAVFNVTAKTTAELVDAFKKITTLSADMAAGEKLPTIQPRLPPVDNNVLDPEPVADGITMIRKR